MGNRSNHRRRGFLSIAILLTGIVLLLLPLLGLEGYRLRLLSLVFMWAALAGCWNLMSGNTGYIDFGPVAYFGVGSYGTALFMIKGGLPFGLSLGLAGGLCALLSLLIGWATLRLQGAYFAIATFAAAEALKQMFLEGDRWLGWEFLGGSHGLTLPPAPGADFFYYSMFFMMILVIGLNAGLPITKLGLGLRAIREAEMSAELAGVPTFRVKISAYLLSAVLIGGIGGIEAYWLTYIIPDDVFNVSRTIQMVIMTLWGGMGTVWGPTVGAVSLTLVAEFLGDRFVYDYLIFMGVIVVVVVLLLPRGIMGAIRRGGKG